MSKDKIRLFHPLVVAEMWLFTIILGALFILGIFLIRDWLFDSFGVYGEKFIPTIDGAIDFHLWFGFALMIFGLIHIVVHILSKKKKDILPKQTGRDFKAFLHSGIYLVGLARREDYGTSERYNGRQRIVYTSLVYILGLTILTGILYYFHFITHDVSMVHVIPAGLSIMVLLFHFLITIRKHDLVALKSAFLTGKIPTWYARKNHPIWYENFRSKRDKITGKILDPTMSQTDRSLIKGGSNLANAVAKFALLLEDSPDKNMIEAITNELRNKHSSDEMQRIIELADELDKEIEIEVKQEEKDNGDSIEPEKLSVTKEEPEQSTEKQKDGIGTTTEELKKVEKNEVSPSEEKIEGHSNESTPSEKSDVEPKAIEEPIKEEKTEDVKKPKIKKEADEIKKKEEKTEESEDEVKKES
jgi:thiosulfate reductase cytochrome b subunit